MYLYRIFYSFLPLRNPIGFGASDLVILFLALSLAVLLVAKALLSPGITKLANRTLPSMAALFATDVALRIALLPHCPIPIPSGADDFGYLLLGDTLRHFRFSNPPHPLHQFFEAVFILQQPTYASIYPLAQGIVLAIGTWLGNPWFGVLASSGLFCALCYWMLRGWMLPQWALAGGILAVTQFGPLNAWMNSYWGGYSSAIAGCLVFGALPRLTKSLKLRDGVILGAGLGLQLLSRPFESVFLVIAVFTYLLFFSQYRLLLLLRPLAAGAVVVSICGVLMLCQNAAVTGNWSTMPYSLSRYQYGVPTTFTLEPNTTPHKALTAEQDIDYRAQSAIHGDRPETLSAYGSRLIYRLRYLRFFLLPPLLPAAFALIPAIRERRLLWAASAVVLFALGTNFYPYFYPQYIAVVACLFVLFAVSGLSRVRGTASTFLFALCGAWFIFWFGLSAQNDPELRAVNSFQSWNYINSGDPQGRGVIAQQLRSLPGQHLIFVRYSALHRFEEWIHNDADIDASQNVWANDLGPEENAKLVRYYPNRTVFLLEPDTHPPLLRRYDNSNNAVLTVH